MQQIIVDNIQMQIETFEAFLTQGLLEEGMDDEWHFISIEVYELC